MILRIAVVIVAGLAGAGFITLASAWFAESLVSLDPKVRRRVQLVEGLLGLASLSLGVTGTQTARERKLALMLLGVIAAAWLFRAARVLLKRARAQ